MKDKKETSYSKKGSFIDGQVSLYDCLTNLIHRSWNTWSTFQRGLQSVFPFPFLVGILKPINAELSSALHSILQWIFFGPQEWEFTSSFSEFFLFIHKIGGRKVPESSKFGSASPEIVCLADGVPFTFTLVVPAASFGSSTSIYLYNRPLYTRNIERSDDGTVPRLWPVVPSEGDLLTSCTCCAIEDVDEDFNHSCLRASSGFSLFSASHLKERQ